MICVCKLPINKIKGYLYPTLSVSGQSSGSPYRVRQKMVLIKTASKTKCPLLYMDYIVTIELILVGDENLTANQNIEIFSAVYSFIRSTQRFK